MKPMNINSTSTLQISSSDALYLLNAFIGTVTHKLRDYRCHVYTFFSTTTIPLCHVSALQLKFPPTASIRFTESVKVLSNYVAAFIWHGFMVFETYFPHLL